MAIQIHPESGTIVICDFKGFVPPEMVKRRPAMLYRRDYATDRIFAPSLH